MINKIAVWLLAALPVALYAQNEPNYTINGTVKNVQLQQVYLVSYGSKGYVYDSARVVNGQYTLTGHVVMPLVATLTTVPNQEMCNFYNSVSVYLSPAERFAVTHTNSFTGINIKGSSSNDEYKRLLKLNKEYNGNEEEKSERIYGDFIRQHPSSPVAIYAFEKYIQEAGKFNAENAPRIMALINLMPSYASMLAGVKQNLETAMNAAKVSVGTQAPDFAQPDTLGNMVSLSSFRGKYVLIDFWASWCGPCRQENPNVVKAYEKYHPKGFEILGVSLDKNDKLWKKAILKDKLNWMHVSDLKEWDNQVAKLYGVGGIPQNFLIDPQGKIIATSLRGADLEKKLAEIYP